MSRRLDMLDELIEKGSKDPFHWYARALEFRSLERLVEALEAFRGVRREFPDYVPTYLIAGQVAVELQRTDDAREFLEAGLRVAKSATNTHAVSELEALLESL